jgi:tRNA uridine 5-carboxymethylaminomethyl modification enzyme
LTGKAPAPERFDVIVVGAGHAGCEAAMAAARMGLHTLLLTINIDRIGHLSCNPAIGGLAKGHMVREIDALGGMMGIWADKAGIQFRKLNTRKGPAVRSSRAQMDRATYMQVVQGDIFAEPTLWVFQDTAEEILTENGRTAGVKTRLGETFAASSVLLTTGTFLSGLIHIGMDNFSGGRLGDPAASGLSKSLTDLGLSLGRLKTGTTPRLLSASIDYEKMEIQPGDDPQRPFSFHAPFEPLPQLPCWLTYTNERVHEIIRGGFERSPLFSGVIEGTGARYCPSIEDKVARFPEKDRHQIFIEPEGLNNPEVYCNGIPTSLPLDVQKAMIREIPGLEDAFIVRPGYAIEYDFVFPTQLKPSLESKAVPGLFCAGQINGTSGYEEAAAQGLWAAINVARDLRDEEPMVLGREEAYTAVLVDDLVTKGTEEPYRMFTSRAEHRLLIREDNADVRLTPLGRKLGLVDDEHWAIYTAKQTGVAELTDILLHTRIHPDAGVLDKLQELGTAPTSKSVTLAELLRRPELSLEGLAAFQPPIMKYAEEVREQAEIQVKYEGYLKRQEELVARSASLHGMLLPEDLDYKAVAGLSSEAVEKLENIRPRTLGQASGISGITPATISCLEVHLKKIGAFTKKYAESKAEPS